MRTWIGIDPGKSGGIAVLTAESVVTLKMPEYDPALWAFLQEAVSKSSSIFGAIEKVGPMPGQGVTSMFTFGAQFGRVHMGCVAAGISFDLVRPHAWQKSLGITSRAENESKPQFKRRLVDRAKSLFPGVQVTLQTADALLLAEYARRVRP